MRYKTVSLNKDLIKKAELTFNLLNMKEAIHIQEVDFWLIDVKTLNKENINSYKTKVNYSHLLFIVNDNEDIKLCLENDFVHYIKSNFCKEELLYWSKYFLDNPKIDKIQLAHNLELEISNSQITKEKEKISLTSQELLLILELSKEKFTQTNHLVRALKVNSQTTIRTVINRIRKKLNLDIFEQKKGFGYKLINSEEKQLQKEFNEKQKEELEEQNRFLQSIIDSSSIFIATFIHKQLYCLNKSFRSFLGENTVKELWEEEKGDFFKLISHKIKNQEELKKELFKKGSNKVEIYSHLKEEDINFEVETLYFENLDKHLLVFKLLK